MLRQPTDSPFHRFLLYTICVTPYTLYVFTTLYTICVTLSHYMCSPVAPLCMRIIQCEHMGWIFEYVVGVRQTLYTICVSLYHFCMPIPCSALDEVPVSMYLVLISAYQCAYCSISLSG